METTQKPVEELSGRELNEAVAEEVFGWYKATPENIPPHYEWSPAEEGCWWRPRPDGGEPDPMHPHDLPRYSSDIRAAWKVLERFSLSEMSGDPEVGYEVALRIKGENGFWLGGFIASAETAPLALCRAAVKAARGARIGLPQVGRR